MSRLMLLEGLLMMNKSNFIEIALEEAVKFSNGKSIKPGGTGNYPVYGSNGIIGGSNEGNHCNAIIIGRVGAYCGSIEYCETHFWASDNTIVAYAKDGFYIKYLYYLLKDLNLNRYAGGAAQPLLTQTVLRQVHTWIPPLPIQRKIAAILSTYDDLIENNMRRIKILEEMARSLYREWFVNFRFPGHQQVKMVDSELGLIPEGWEFKKLTELGLLKRGKSKHRPRNDPSLYGGKYPFIQTGEVKSALLYITNYEQTYNEKGLAQSKLWEPKTLLITIAANIAETAIITMSACFPDSIVGFIADSNQVNSELIKYQIDELKQKMQNFSRGTAQDNLSLDKLEVFNFLVPDQNIFELFNEHTEPIFLQIKNLTIKNNNLRQTRDLLLPKLISGEIDVENLDIKTGEIAA